MKVTLLMDNPNSWYAPYADKLATQIQERGHEVARISHAEDLPEGDCAFFLSCEKLIPAPLRARHTHNIVIHASALPQGKGWSPLTWKILEGENEITLSLFEAADAVDSGVIYDQEQISFKGDELIEELREKEGNAINVLALRFLDSYPPQHGREQSGEESFYPRRAAKDSELDPQKSIAEQFDLLRVVDNERYPAFFKHKGRTYILKIFKQQ